MILTPCPYDPNDGGQAAYLSSEGNMDAVMESIVHAVVEEDEPRFKGTPPSAHDTPPVRPRLSFITWVRCPGWFFHTNTVKDWKCCSS